MDYARFVASRKEIWDRFERELGSARSLAGKRYEEIESLVFDYRRVLHDYALAQARFPSTGAMRRLARLAVRGNRLLTRQHSERRRSLVDFFRKTFPAAFRRRLGTIALAAALFAGTALFGFAATLLEPTFGTSFIGPEAVQGLREGRLWTDELTTAIPPGVSSSLIATNNLSVAITAWAGGALAGLGSVYIVFLNGLMLGAVVGVTVHYSMAVGLLEFISAHGPLELTVIVVSAAGGLVLARGMIVADDRPRAVVLRSASRDAFTLLIGCLPWLVVLALVESFVSPSPAVDPRLKSVLGVALEGLFLTLAWRPLGEERR